MTKRYATLSEFHAARTSARAERDLARVRLSQRWALVQDPRSRGTLLKDAVSDVLVSWAPYRRVKDLLHGRVSGSTVAAVGMAVASAQHGMGKRILFSGLSMLLGRVLGGRQPNDQGLLHTVASAVGRGVHYMRERKAARQQHAQEAEPQIVDERP
jgi:hypothetical protein